METFGTFCYKTENFSARVDDINLTGIVVFIEISFLKKRAGTWDANEKTPSNADYGTCRTLTERN